MNFNKKINSMSNEKEKAYNKRRDRFYEAAFNCDVEVLEELFKEGMSVNTECYLGDTALHYATDRRHFELVIKLIEKGAEINKRNQCGQTALHIAAEDGFCKLVELLLRKGAYINIPNAEGHTPLHVAASNGNNQLVELLLEKGAQVDCQNTEGRTALHVAASNGNIELVKLLLERGALYDTQTSEGRTALHIASCNGHSEVVGMLLEKGADVDSISAEDGFTPLHLACKRGRREVVNMLLNSGAVADKQTKNLDTPLHLACSKGSVSIASSLLEKGADINKQNYLGFTPLIKACNHNNYNINHYEVIDFLLRKGAAINKQDDFGDTALHKAACVNVRACRILLNNGAKIDIRNEDGKTPLETCLDTLEADMHMPLINCNETIVELSNVLVRHIVKLKLAGQFVNVDISGVDPHVYLETRAKCLQELSEIKKCKIFKGFLLGNVLFNFNQPYYLRNSQLVIALEEFLYSQNADKQFPLYILLLRNTLNSSKVRFELLVQAAESMCSGHRREWCRQLTDSAIEEILSYLSDDDLRSLIRSEE